MNQSLASGMHPDPGRDNPALHPDTSLPSDFIVCEASVDDDGVLTLVVRADPAATLSVSFEGATDVVPLHALADGRFELRRRLPASVTAVELQTSKSGQATQRQSLSLWGRFDQAAERSFGSLVSKRVGAQSFLQEATGRVVLFAAAQVSGQAWDKLSELAARVRQESHVPVLLFCGPHTTFNDSAGRVLNSFDAAAVLSPARALAVGTGPWDHVSGDPAMENALSRLLPSLAGASSLIAESPQLLVRLGKPAVALRRAALVDRAEVSAPRSIFVPQHRQRLVTHMRDRLRGILALLPDEATRAVLLRFCPAAETLTLQGTANRIMAELGLESRDTKTRLDEVLRRVFLRARLAQGGEGVLLDGLSAEGRDLLMADIADLPGNIHAFRLGGGVHGLPVGQAHALGVKRLLVLAEGQGYDSLAASLEQWGVEPTPLLPRTTRPDRQIFDALRGSRAGGHAILLDGDSAGSDVSTDVLVLQAGTSAMPESAPDVVELGWAGDPRRGRLASLFDATAAPFWTRPASRAGDATLLGYDPSCLPRLLPGSGSRFEALLLFALHVGCASLELRVTADEARRLLPLTTALAQRGLMVSVPDRRRAA